MSAGGEKEAPPPSPPGEFAAYGGLIIGRELAAIAAKNKAAADARAAAGLKPLVAGSRTGPKGQRPVSVRRLAGQTWADVEKEFGPLPRPYVPRPRPQQETRKKEEGGGGADAADADGD